MTDHEVDLMRRRSFTQLLGDLLVSAEEIQGHRHFPLNKLATLERAKLTQLIPGMNTEFELYISNGRLVGKNRNTRKKIQLFDIDPIVTTAFNLINGRNNIGEITRAFSERMNWTDEESYLYVKNLILQLVGLEACWFLNIFDDHE